MKNGQKSIRLNPNQSKTKFTIRINPNRFFNQNQSELIQDQNDSD